MKAARWADVVEAQRGRLAQLKASGSELPATPLTVCLQTQLAGALGQVGRLDEAITLLGPVAEQARQTLGPDTREALDADFQLATLYARQGQYDKAVPVYRTLLPRLATVHGASSLPVASVARNLSTALHWLGNYSDALPYDVRALQIVNALTPGPGPCDTAAVCRGLQGQASQNLADTLNRLSRFDEALPQARRGVELQREAKGEQHPDVLDAKLVLATTWLGQGHIDEAREIQRQVLQTARAAWGDAHPISRKAAGDLAASSRTLAEQREGVQLEEQNLASIKARLGPQHPETLLGTSNLVGRYERLQQWDKALALAEDGVKALFGRTDTLMFDDRTQDAWQRSQERLTDAYLALLIRHHREPDAFLFTEVLKYRKLSLALQGQMVASAQPGLAADIKRASRRLALLDQRLALARSLEQPTDGLNSARAGAFQAWKQLVDGAPAALPSMAEPPNWARLLVGDGQPMISYRQVGKSLLAFVLSGPQMNSLLLDDQDRVRPTIEAYRLSMRYLTTRGGAKDPASLPLWRLPDGSYRFSPRDNPAGSVRVANPAEVLSTLSDWLIKPLMPKLEGRQRLRISVDQNLGHVPFEALPLAQGLLGDRVEVSLLPSFALYELLSQRRVDYALAQRRPMLAIGGAQYASFDQYSPLIRIQREREKTITPMDRKILWQSIQRDRRLLPLAFAMQMNGTLDMSDLPGSAAEVETIAQTVNAWKQGRAEVLSGAQASEQRLNELDESGALKSFRLVHFSTHGFLSDDEPALSAIVLKQVNREAGTDGYLTAAELSTMSLGSDLVVVSACDSGASEQLAGQGAAGLSFALFQAGTVSSLLTLWPVEDQASSRFMGHFYEELKASDAASAALQRTKVWARAQGLSPHVVQGFVLWGI
jgi:CHAT domain-containing protein/tetratricopeptide (TPR) repeat protein